MEYTNIVQSTFRTIESARIAHGLNYLSNRLIYRINNREDSWKIKRNVVILHTRK